ncbi:hypothetical protein [Desulfovibrio cuneatus]|uniref:hypothetical protein n=1 Tax=Desulfovibrio cuneatus TaxID=159728 RepID=UPI000411D299|nr:hypothetical protein [Desulfovibrio cuneatus]
MTNAYEAAKAEQRKALESLSYEGVLAALENEEQVVMDAMRERVLVYTDKAGQALSEGQDYLPVLTPTDDDSILDVVAMDIVRDVFDEEMEDL